MQIKPFISSLPQCAVIQVEAVDIDIRAKFRSHNKTEAAGQAQAASELTWQLRTSQPVDKVYQRTRKKHNKGSQQRITMSNTT
jgi:hypothetical protein